MRCARSTVGDVPVRALRVTFVGELGWELYCPTEYGAGLWRALWEAGARARPRRRRLPGDRLDAPGEGLPRVGGRHHAGRDPVRGRARLLRQARQGGRLHRRARRSASGDGERRRRARGCAASCSRTRARSRSATSRCASAARSSAASRAAATATRSSARSPTRTCRPSVELGHRGRDRHLRPAGSPARSRASRCSTPGASGCAGPSAARRGRAVIRSTLAFPPHVLTVVGSIAFDAVKTPFGSASACSAARPCTSRWRPRSSTRCTSSAPSATTSARPNTTSCARAASTPTTSSTSPGGKTFFWRGEYGWDLNDARDARHPAQRVRRVRAQALGGLARADVLFLANIQPDLQRAGPRAVRAARASWRWTR